MKAVHWGVAAACAALAALAAGAGNEAGGIRGESVRKVRVVDTNGETVVLADVTFRHEADGAVKFRDFGVDVFFDVQGGRVERREGTGLEVVGGGSTQKVVRVTDTPTQRIRLGRYDCRELLFEKPAKPGERPARQLRIVIGPSDRPETRECARQVLNLVIDPDQPFVMKLEGAGKLGIPIANGFRYEPLEIELLFTPVTRLAFDLVPGAR